MAGKKSEVLRKEALEIFASRGGILRTGEAVAAGIHPRLLYELRDSGKIERLERGLYGLAGLPGVGHPDLITVAKMVPSGVICLTSALYFHHLTVQIPRHVDVAVPKSYKPIALHHPPTRFYWYSDKSYELGIEKHELSGTEVKVYSREKTIVDCFKHRNKVGVNVAIEALKTCWESGFLDLNLLTEYAKELRMAKVLQPYIEAMIHDQS